ncbi:MAG TPA: hypothetical protein VIC84_15410 [Blastocatellia bacterium]|jgi:hypothetical protein
MKQRKNQEARNRAMLLAVIIFLASVVVSLTLNLLFARQRETRANRREP